MGYRVWYGGHLDFEESIAHLEEEYRTWQEENWDGLYGSCRDRTFSFEDETKSDVGEELEATLKWFEEKGFVCREGFLNYEGEEQFDNGHMYIKENKIAVEEHTERGLIYHGKIDPSDSLVERYGDFFDLLASQLVDIDLPIKRRENYAHRFMQVKHSIETEICEKECSLIVEICLAKEKATLSIEGKDIYEQSWDFYYELLEEDFEFGARFLNLFVYSAKKSTDLMIHARNTSEVLTEKGESNEGV